MIKDIDVLLDQDKKQIETILTRFPGTFANLYAVKVLPDTIVERIEEEKVKTGTDEDGLDTYEIKEKKVTEPSKYRRAVILKEPVCHTWINGKGELIDTNLLPKIGDIVVYDKFQAKPFDHMKDIDILVPYSIMCWYNQRDPQNKYEDDIKK